MTKLNVVWRFLRTPIGAGFVGVLALLLLVGHRVEAETSRTESDAAEPETRGGNPNAALFPVPSHPYGFSLETWAENWWRYLLAIPAAQNPFLTQSADCSVGQGGPVFFVPPVTVGSHNLSRSCAIEHGKAVAITLSSVLNDYPCPDPTFQPAPGQSL